RMLEVLDKEPGVADRNPSTSLGVIPSLSRDKGPPHISSLLHGPPIEFRNLTFSFGDQVILRDISAVLPAGTTTAIVGATGSGKSTLLNLIPRLHDPPPGTLFVNGTDVRDIPLDVLRGAIGFVPQEPFLFSATLAQNMAFGARGEQDTPTRVEQAATTARLDTDMAEFPR